ncbi:MAG: bifunctional folylpolyglutamate synthase/dihydrofolate synthase [Rhodospirillaceae bacterium]|nr:MAG: bifunctional folylpolyglutamate synthase/dihydrofolate synthase [Rhodospirillaceae bacterium]
MSPPPVDAVLERMTRLHPKLIDLSLDRVRRLLADLGNPQDKLPPVIHVAGTNGKGSTIATMRAVLEAGGYKVHAYTSPHLVRFTERIRLVGSLIDEDLLIALLEHIEEVNAGRPITFFEITTVAAFLAFARIPADVTLLETGMGGRLDATNVVVKPLVTVLTSISMDHTQFLGDTVAAIAAEKAAIMKPGVPCVSVAQHPDAAAVIDAAATRIGAMMKWQGRNWRMEPAGGAGKYLFTGEHASWTVPRPSLPGRHQIENAGAALAALDQSGIAIPDFALRQGLKNVVWPARAQRLTKGPLAQTLPNAWELWLDGGHNAGGGQVLAHLAADQWADAPLHLVCGMLSTKAAEDFLHPLAHHATSLTTIEIPGSAISYSAAELAMAAANAGFASVRRAASVQQAVAAIVMDYPKTFARVLICGALYLAGEVLKENG